MNSPARYAKRTSSDFPGIYWTPVTLCLFGGDNEIRDLIRRMSLDNPFWGDARNDWFIAREIEE